MAGTTGLEPATSAVTGQRSNQLNYVPSCFSCGQRDTRMFAVFSCCLPFLLRQPLYTQSIEIRGEMGSKDSKLKSFHADAGSRDPEHLSLLCEGIVADRIQISTGTVRSPTPPIRV